MTTPINPPLPRPRVTCDRLHVLAASIGLHEDDYANRDVKPFDRYRIYGRPYSGYEFQSGVSTRGYRKGRYLFARLREYETDDEIVAKLKKLRARSEKEYLQQLADDARRERDQREYEEREEKRKKEWIAAIRVAFGNPPDQPLEKETLPKVLTKAQLVDARQSDDILIKLPPLNYFREADPVDVEVQHLRRARFLVELDAFLARQLAEADETSETPVNKHG